MEIDKKTGSDNTQVIMPNAERLMQQGDFKSKFLLSPSEEFNEMLENLILNPELRNSAFRIGGLPRNTWEGKLRASIGLPQVFNFLSACIVTQQQVDTTEQAPDCGQ